MSTEREIVTEERWLRASDAPGTDEAPWSDMRSWLTAGLALVPAEYADVARVHNDSDSDYPPRWCIRWRRLETDDERRSREILERVAQARRVDDLMQAAVDAERSERLQYERLRKKYGNTQGDE